MSHLRYEATDEVELSQKRPDLLFSLRLWHVCDGFDLGGVNLNAPAADNESQELARRDSESTLGWVELELVLAKTVKDFAEINKVLFLAF